MHNLWKSQPEGEFWDGGREKIFKVCRSSRMAQGPLIRPPGHGILYERKSRQGSTFLMRSCGQEQCSLRWNYQGR